MRFKCTVIANRTRDRNYEFYFYLQTHTCAAAADRYQSVIINVKFKSTEKSFVCVSFPFCSLCLLCFRSPVLPSYTSKSSWKGGKTMTKKRFYCCFILNECCGFFPPLRQHIHIYMIWNIYTMSLPRQFRRKKMPNENCNGEDGFWILFYKVSGERKSTTATATAQNSYSQITVIHTHVLRLWTACEIQFNLCAFMRKDLYHDKHILKQIVTLTMQINHWTIVCVRECASVRAWQLYFCAFTTAIKIFFFSINW